MSIQGDKYDYEHVNFSEDHELNTHLKKHGKSQSVKNRGELKVMGDELKARDSKRVLTHKEFDAYISVNLGRLDNPA